MPIWLRRFTFSKINEYFTSVNEQTKQVANSSTSLEKLHKGSNITPSYSTKASSK